ncbi:hypothetical protein ACV36R_31000, partial [Pseudomonas aeruginosa]
WRAGDPTGAKEPDRLIIGDLNSYAKEDPVNVIRGAGYTDLVARQAGVGEGVVEVAGLPGEHVGVALSCARLTRHQVGV